MKFVGKGKAALLMIGILLLSLFACLISKTVLDIEKTQEGSKELIFDHEEILQYAEGFTLCHYKEGYTVFTIPGTCAKREYLIVPEGKEIPFGLKEDTVILQQPITKLCIASGSLASLAAAIDAVDCIKAVAIERENWTLQNVQEGIDEGNICYSGSFRNPDFELLLTEGIQLEIDTTMLLNYPEIMEKYDEIGIPYFIEDSTKEASPLARMEWIKLLGAILGKEEEANRYFEEQKAKIEGLDTAEGSSKETALFYMGEKSLYVRNGGDYIPSMLRLAGGRYCMEEFNPEQGGSLKISFEDFYSKCKDAEYLFWVVLECPYDTIEELIGANELFADFRAVQNGNVYKARKGFAQRTADFADVILEMNKILNDSEIEETDTFVKLK